VIVSLENPPRTEERDDRAYALMQTALELIPQGQWREAARLLEEAASIHAEGGRSYDEARCLQLTAALRRSGGEAGKAHALLERAAAVAQDVQPLTVSISAEEAETALAEGRYQDAVAAWTKALDQGRQSGLKPKGISAILRRRAAAFAALGEIEQANSDFDQACLTLGSAGERQKSRFVRIEQAELLWRYGRLDETERVVARLETDLANTEVSPHLFAELLVLRARLARARGELDNALDYARRSRDAALQAVAPVSYFAASVEVAGALQAQGDFSNAYGALSTAWATLSDVLGEETARSWIEPCLLMYQVRWGESVFRQAKKEYEARRRAELKLDNQNEGSFRGERL
jgi:ATP/maltotriose-dependent transcriptional regulator MalT